METPFRAFTSENPASSVMSSPAKIGLRPWNGDFGQKRLNCAALVAAPQHDFIDHFALKQTQIGMFADDLVNNVAATPFKVRAQPIM